MDAEVKYLIDYLGHDFFRIENNLSELDESQIAIVEKIQNVIEKINDTSYGIDKEITLIPESIWLQHFFALLPHCPIISRLHKEKLKSVYEKITYQFPCDKGIYSIIKSQKPTNFIGHYQTEGQIKVIGNWKFDKSPFNFLGSKVAEEEKIMLNKNGHFTINNKSTGAIIQGEFGIQDINRIAIFIIPQGHNCPIAEPYFYRFINDNTLELILGQKRVALKREIG